MFHMFGWLVIATTGPATQLCDQLVRDFSAPFSTISLTIRLQLLAVACVQYAVGSSIGNWLLGAIGEHVRC